MYRFTKRTLDIIVSFLALVILSPILLLLMLLIRLDSPGSPVFAQKRIGRHGKPFTVYKLRTMSKEAPKSVATGELENAHGYITRLGKFLRKTSLDELPQLVNIFIGNMSLVGPRPLVPEEVAVHEERMALGVYEFCPGITGWAQINGRDQVQPGMKAQLDAYYAENASLSLDARIIFKTAVYVLTAQGIQEGAQPPAGEAENEVETEQDG